MHPIQNSFLQSLVLQKQYIIIKTREKIGIFTHTIKICQFNTRKKQLMVLIIKHYSLILFLSTHIAHIKGTIRHILGIMDNSTFFQGIAYQILQYMLVLLVLLLYKVLGFILIIYLLLKIFILKEEAMTYVLGMGHKRLRIIQFILRRRL